LLQRPKIWSIGKKYLSKEKISQASLKIKNSKILVLKQKIVLATQRNIAG
jgi:hypothetical protein